MEVDPVVGNGSVDDSKDGSEGEEPVVSEKEGKGEKEQKKQQEDEEPKKQNNDDGEQRTVGGGKIEVVDEPEDEVEDEEDDDMGSSLRRVTEEIEEYNDPILKQTLKACQSGGYMLKDKPIGFDVEKVKESILANRMYDCEVDLKKFNFREFECVTYAQNVDAVECAFDLQKEINRRGSRDSDDDDREEEKELEKEEEQEEKEEIEEKVLLLNMGNSEKPGGMKGSPRDSFEQDLLRRSNYFLHLTEAGHRITKITSIDWSYPIPEFGAIYSPDVLFFRTSLAEKYGPLSLPISLDCIASSPYDWPAKDLDDYNEGTKRKIAAVLSIALITGHTHLVLGAFGCEGLENPPKHIADLFAQVLQLPQFKNKFVKIVFAINGDGEHYGSFVDMFGELRVDNGVVTIKGGVFEDPASFIPRSTNWCWSDYWRECCWGGSK